MSDLVDFLNARLDEDEAWASACEGLHWEWRNGDDELITPDPLLDEHIDDETSASLRSVETFPYASLPGEGPRFLIWNAETTLTTVAGHIARHDPARVLVEVQAKREVVDFLAGLDVAWNGVSGDPLLRELAAVYKDHPDYDERWTP